MAALGARLHFEEGVWAEAGAGAEAGVEACAEAGEELAEGTAEEAMCREDGADDGEASRSPDSILWESILSSVTSRLCKLSVHTKYPPCVSFHKSSKLIPFRSSFRVV